MFEPLGEKKLMVDIQQLQLSNWNNDQLIENRTGEAVIDSKQQKLCNEILLLWDAISLCGFT